MNYYYRLPSDCYLEVEIDKISDNFTANIELKSDKGNNLKINLNRVGAKKISLSQFSDQFVKFAFSDDINTQKKSYDSCYNDGTVSWSKIAISTVSKNPREVLTEQQGEGLKEFRSKVKNLDIIYIIFDAFNAKHSSLYGYERKTTPFLDKLAEKSVVFDNFYANHPYTLASTATLLTSRYSYEHGLIDKNHKLSAILPVLPEILTDNNMCSFLITGHAFFSEEWGLPRGFTKVFFDDCYKRNTEKITKALDSIYESEWGQRRKFIYLHLIPPHDPYDPPEKYKVFTNSTHTPISPDACTLNKIQTGELQVTKNQLDYIKAMYDSNVLYADHIAKEIFEFIQKRNIHEKAIVMIASDHGEAFMEHGYTTHNTTVYDEMIHIPLIISLPHEVYGIPKRVEHIASIIDITPTILDIFDIHSDLSLQGETLLPKIFSYRGETSIYAETLITGQRCIRSLKYKFISCPKTGRQLYDIVQDPSERQNLFGQEAVISGYFMQKLRPKQARNETRPRSIKVDLNTLDIKTRQQLKELGYIK